MKRWMWEDGNTWHPIVVCPYCSTAWNPIVIHWCTRCPQRVHPPKKDYWESMKEKAGDDEK